MNTENKTCETCEFAIKDEKMLQLLRCHFNPPSTLPAMDPQGRMGYITQFPAVQTHEWCAQWRCQSPKLITQ